MASPADSYYSLYHIIHRTSRYGTNYPASPPPRRSARSAAGFARSRNSGRAPGRQDHHRAGVDERLAAPVGALRSGEAPGPAGAHARAGTGLERLSGARRAGRSSAHAPDLRDPAAPLRRPESQGRLRASRERLARLGEGRLGNPGGQDPLRQNGRLLTVRSRVWRRRAAMAARRVSACVPGGLACRLAGLDGLVHADLR